MKRVFTSSSVITGGVTGVKACPSSSWMASAPGARAPASRLRQAVAGLPALPAERTRAMRALGVLVLAREWLLMRSKLAGSSRGVRVARPAAAAMRPGIGRVLTGWRGFARCQKRAGQRGA